MRRRIQMEGQEQGLDWPRGIHHRGCDSNDPPLLRAGQQDGVEAHGPRAMNCNGAKLQVLRYQWIPDGAERRG